MAKTYYLPTGDRDKAQWLRNFSTTFAGYASLLGFTEADVTSLNNDSVAFAYILDDVELLKSEARERTSYKDLLRDGGTAVLGAFPTLPTLSTTPTAVAAGIFPRVANMVKRIKAHPNYTEAIGRDLGIIGAEEGAGQRIALKPTVTLSTDGGVVVVKYIKGHTAGIRLMCCRGSETEFTLLATVTKPMYKDSRPNLVAGQPEQRKYCAWYLQDDQPTGQCSDEVSIVV